MSLVGNGGQDLPPVACIPPQRCVVVLLSPTLPVCLLRSLCSLWGLNAGKHGRQDRVFRARTFEQELSLGFFWCCCRLVVVVQFVVDRSSHKKSQITWYDDAVGTRAMSFDLSQQQRDKCQTREEMITQEEKMRDVFL